MKKDMDERYDGRALRRLIKSAQAGWWWSKHRLNIILNDMAAGKGYGHGHMGRLVVPTLIICGYKPALPVIAKRWAKELEKGSGRRERNELYQHPATDYRNVLKLPNWKLVEKGQKRKITRDLRRYYRHNPLLNYEERYWFDYFDVKTGTLQKHEGEEFEQLREAVRDFNQNFESFDFNDFKNFYDQIIAMAYYR